MATEVVDCISEEIAKELERIRGEVLRAKEELRIRFKYYSQVLHVKYRELEVQRYKVILEQRHKQGTK